MRERMAAPACKALWGKETQVNTPRGALTACMQVLGTKETRDQKLLSDPDSE